MPTDRQQLVIDKIVVKSRSKKFINDKGDLLRESGYAEATAIKPSQVFNSKGVQDGLKPVLKVMREKRDMALRAITQEKIDDSKAKELADIADTLTKNIQLLSGGETQRVAIIDKINYIVPEEKKDN